MFRLAKVAKPLLGPLWVLLYNVWEWLVEQSEFELFLEVVANVTLSGSLFQWMRRLVRQQLMAWMVAPEDDYFQQSRVFPVSEWVKHKLKLFTIDRTQGTLTCWPNLLYLITAVGKFLPLDGKNRPAKK